MLVAVAFRTLPAYSVRATMRKDQLMRAIQLFGDRDVRLVELDPPPAPAAGEAQIRMRTVGLNHLDVWGFRGMAFAKRKLPLTVAAEGVGEVVAVGAGVTNVRPGQRVVLAMIPVELELTARIAGGKREGDFRRGGEGQFVRSRGLNLDAVGTVELEHGVRRVHIVAGPIAEGAVAEFEPAAPFDGHIAGTMRNHGGGTDPLIPVESIGHGFSRRATVRVAPDDVLPCMSLGHLAEDAGLDPGLQHEDAATGMPLVAHLTGEPGLLLQRHEVTGLGDTMGQGLFKIDRLAGLQAPLGAVVMGMIGRGDDDPIDRLAMLFQHPAEVRI